MKRVDRPTWTAAGFQRRHWEAAWEEWDEATIRAALDWEGILPLCRRAFPAGARLLEAGCGTGKYCLALARAGYRVVGVDFARSGLDVLRRVAPGLPAVCGSVVALPFPDGSFDGALSLGVVEHFEEGPEAAIAELARVVRPGGTLLLTVPFEHLLVPSGVAAAPPAGEPPASGPALAAAMGGARAAERAFYQYLFRRDEMAGRLERAGFRVTRVRYLAKLTGLAERRAKAAPPRAPAAPSRRAGGLKALVKRGAPGLARALRRLQLAAVEAVLPGPLCAHTIAFVARRG